MVAAVILPGLDGAGALRSEFAAALEPHLDPIAITFPNDRPLGYQALHNFVRSQLPSEPFVLIGESFSGPLACLLAASRPEGLQALFLCATFARSPVRWLSPFASLAGALPLHAAPRSILSWALFGSWAAPAQVAALQAILLQTPLGVLQHRAKEALRINVTQRLPSIAVPAFGLRASHDRMVGPGATAQFVAHLPSYREVSISGPHAILQAAPQACATQVIEACRSHGIAGVF